MSQKPHLDDFFAAARREEPVISHEEIGELIDARHTGQTPTTHHITWKGMSMTTFGLGLAAVLSYFAFFTQDAFIAPLAIPVQSQQSSAIAPEIKTLVAPRVEAGKQYAAVTDVQEAVTPKEAVRVEAPIKVDEVRITEPSQDDMKRLGMKVDGGREVVVVQKVGKKFFVITYGAKPFRVSSQLEPENPTDIEPTNVLPVFVTNLDGTGILTATAPNENLSIMTKEVHTSNTDGAGERTVERTQTNVIVSSEVDEDLEHTIVKDVDVDVSIDGPAIMIDPSHFNFKFDDSTMIEAFANAGHASGQAKIMIKRGDGDVSIDLSSGTEDPKEIEKMKKELRIEINDEDGKHAIKVQGLDSIHKKVMIAKLHADSSKLQMMDMHKELGLVREKVAAQLKDLKIRINDSNIQVDMKKLLEELKHAKGDLKSKKELHLAHPKSLKARKHAFVLPGFEELKAKVNELVPMRVNLNDAKGKGLIFWYEPSVAPVLPKQEAQSIASSAFDNITINPNPARDHATVRFAMKDANAVTISVHDILGKRLLEAGQVIPGAGGEFSREIDLSSLTQGVYLVVLTTDTGEQRIERILVNK